LQDRPDSDIKSRCAHWQPSRMSTPYTDTSHRDIALESQAEVPGAGSFCRRGRDRFHHAKQDSRSLLSCPQKVEVSEEAETESRRRRWAANSKTKAFDDHDPPSSTQLPTTTRSALVAYASLTHYDPSSMCPQEHTLTHALLHCTSFTEARLTPLHHMGNNPLMSIFSTETGGASLRTYIHITQYFLCPCPLAQIPLESHSAGPTRLWFLYF
jgi:hypothetical protein